MSDLPRAYLHLEGKWRHVYIIETYEQMNLLGWGVIIARVRLTAKSSIIHEVEQSKLEHNKPRRQRK
jgi:hypothetical protein